MTGLALAYGLIVLVSGLSFAFGLIGDQKLLIGGLSWITGSGQSAPLSRLSSTCRAMRGSRIWMKLLTYSA